MLKKERIVVFPEELKYTDQHEWTRIESDSATIGITDYAQQSLGDIVYVELPEIGTEVKKGEEFGTIESVKAASDTYSPLTGEVTEINEDLQEHPEYINQSPYDKGWIIKIKIKDSSEINDLMNSHQYQEYIKSETE